jgi:hypothetical protein
MPDEAALAELRQANAHHAAAEYERRLAAKIAEMLPEARDEALRVLKLVEAVLNLPAG